MRADRRVKDLLRMYKSVTDRDVIRDNLRIKDREEREKQKKRDVGL